MAAASENFKSKAQAILSQVDEHPIDPKEQVRLVQDLQSVERKLQTMHHLYTEAYEKVSQLEKELVAERQQ